MKTKTPRMYYKDFRKLRRIIPPRKDETTANYFERVVESLKDLKEMKMQRFGR